MDHQRSPSPPLSVAADQLRARRGDLPPSEPAGPGRVPTGSRSSLPSRSPDGSVSVRWSTASAVSIEVTSACEAGAPSSSRPPRAAMNRHTSDTITAKASTVFRYPCEPRTGCLPGRRGHRIEISPGAGQSVPHRNQQFQPGPETDGHHRISATRIVKRTAVQRKFKAHSELISWTRAAARTSLPAGEGRATHQPGWM